MMEKLTQDAQRPEIQQQQQKQEGVFIIKGGLKFSSNSKSNKRVAGYKVYAVEGKMKEHSGRASGGLMIDILRWSMGGGDWFSLLQFLHLARSIAITEGIILKHMKHIKVGFVCDPPPPDAIADHSLRHPETSELRPEGNTSSFIYILIPLHMWEEGGFKMKQQRGYMMKTADALWRWRGRWTSISNGKEGRRGRI
ncbi:hypothetical protein QJS10_CPB15g01133 [Acorus calamus]|uniref:Uncharacterized protein n=1 Tax=Acorus calamus TaxID=4465 RepID=A0AAV9D4D3_ACOCL|nr:hypothetical protein QJS10_CPB15g01133 [Acorus calamus]